MGTRLNPYISFKDNAREAMTFYAAALGGEPAMMTFEQMGDQSEAKDLIMHAQLETPSGYTLMASDTPPGMEWAPAAGITVSLSGDDRDELRGYWDKLSEGGTITLPLEPQMWGDEFGMFTDKFGVGWLVNIAGDHSQD